MAVEINNMQRLIQIIQRDFKDHQNQIITGFQAILNKIQDFDHDIENRIIQDQLIILLKKLNTPKRRCCLKRDQFQNLCVRFIIARKIKNLKLTYFNQAYINPLYNKWIKQNQNNIELFLQMIVLSNQIKDIYSQFSYFLTPEIQNLPKNTIGNKIYSLFQLCKNRGDNVQKFQLIANQQNKIRKILMIKLKKLLKIAWGRKKNNINQSSLPPQIINDLSQDLPVQIIQQDNQFQLPEISVYSFEQLQSQKLFQNQTIIQMIEIQEENELLYEKHNKCFFDLLLDNNNPNQEHQSYFMQNQRIKVSKNDKKSTQYRLFQYSQITNLSLQYGGY